MLDTITNHKRTAQQAIEATDPVSQRALASAALYEAREDMRYHRHEAAVAWTAIAQAHIALARELREGLAESADQYRDR